LKSEARSCQTVQWSDRLYSWLLILYPSEFRAEYGAEMAQLFRDERRDALAECGSWGLAALWLRTLAALVTTAAGEHLDMARRDLRYGLRTLLADPGFTVLSVSILAVGIGAFTALFGVVNTVLLRPLPFAAAERLVVVQQEKERSAYGVSYPNFRDWRERNRVFSGMAVYNATHFTLAGGDRPRRVTGAVVSAGLFSLLGAAPELGRDFRPEEDRFGGGPAGRVAILSHSLWLQRFNGERRVLGRALTLNGLSYTVVGVMGARFRFPVQNDPVELWTTVAFDAEPTLYGGTIPTSRGYPHYSAALARLKPEVGLGAARADLQLVARSLAGEYPAFNTGVGVRITPAIEWLTGEVRPLLLVLFAAVGCVLLIACTNVANLLLARSSTRGREIAVRLALGATQARIVRQLLTESLLLALGGGAAGGVLAFVATWALGSLLPGDIPRAAEIGLDGAVLGFALAVSLATGLGFGLVPALQFGRGDGMQPLKDAARSVSGAGGRLRSALIVAEVALAMGLLVGAGLLVQSFVRLSNVDPGFSARGVLSFQVDLPEIAYPQGSSQVTQFYRRLLERIGELPGVRSATVAQFVPLSGLDNGTSVEFEGRPSTLATRQAAALRFVGLNFFRTLGIPIRRGRDFVEADDANAPERVIVNAEFARRFFGGTDPLGRRIRLGFGGRGFKEIVGVAADIRHAGLGLPAEPEMYVPQAQYPINAVTVLVRTDADLGAFAPAVRSIVQALDSRLPIYSVRALDAILADSIAQPRFQTLLLVLFAGVALLLAAAGIYGVTAYSVSRRAREMGIRLALGASPAAVMRLVIVQGMSVVLLGIAIGAAISLSLSWILTSQLFGISATDPITFAAAALVLVGVALLACYLPARRATRVEPMVVLRGD
jgi:putative ABC transport system permease protein